jgi:hypothetical protein
MSSRTPFAAGGRERDLTSDCITCAVWLRMVIHSPELVSSGAADRARATSDPSPAQARVRDDNNKEGIEHLRGLDGYSPRSRPTTQPSRSQLNMNRSPMAVGWPRSLTCPASWLMERRKKPPRWKLRRWLCGLLLTGRSRSGSHPSPSTFREQLAEQ